MPIDLPRFNAHPEGVDAGPLVPKLRRYDPDARAGVPVPVGGDEPLTLTVTGYWPYAEIEALADLVPDGGETAIKLTHAPHEGHDPEAEGEQAPQWLFPGRPGMDALVTEQVAMRHVARADLEPEQLLQAAGEVHQIQVTTPGGELETGIVPGQTVEVGGYELRAERAVPSWRTIDGRLRDAFVIHVDPPDGAHFNRMVLDGEDLQTDFADDPSAGPMGQRQDAPLDDDLVVRYRFADTLQLTPRQAPVRHTLLTRPGESAVHLLTIANDRPPALTEHDDAFEIGGFLAERVDDVRWSERVVEVPADRRNEDDGRAGLHQVVRVELARGDWSADVLVPFGLWPHLQPWTGPVVDVPGVAEPVRLQLGNLARPMPRRVQVDRFEAIPYDGEEASATALMRDFRSEVTLIDERTGRQRSDVAQLNDPVFITLDGPLWYDESWLLYQASWDPENQAFTVLGVGNRPGIRTMVVGCVLMGVGLMWAFYVKPVIIRRRKNAALRKHREQQAQPGVALA